MTENKPFPNAHVFVVDNNTFTVHSKFEFCGVVNPNGVNERYGVYADLMSLRNGDIVFFYQRYSSEERESNGFHGIYEIDGDPFFDPVDITDQTTGKTVKGKCICGHVFSPKRANQFSPAKCLNCNRIIDFPILPNRIKIKVKKFFEKSVEDDYAYVDHTDHGILWTMLFRKTTGAGRARSIMHILPEESEKLIRLLQKINNNQTSTLVTQSYTPSNTATPITLNLNNFADRQGNLSPETVLHAWIMQNIDKNIPVLKDIIGPLNELEYFGAWVPYNLATKTVDILCLHKRDGIRFKATVIELKQGKINQSAVNQVKDYTPWIAQLVTENAEPEINNIEIQPIVIGTDKTRNLNLPNVKTMSLKYFSNSLSGSRRNKQITINQPKLLGYRFDSTNNTVKFRML